MLAQPGVAGADQNRPGSTPSPPGVVEEPALEATSGNRTRKRHRSEAMGRFRSMAAPSPVNGSVSTRESAEGPPGISQPLVRSPYTEEATLPLSRMLRPLDALQTES
jgi:hypothetical protein